MKKFRKAFALVLVLIMALALAVPAFAATGNGSLKINGVKPGEKYSIFRILDLDYVKNSQGENYSYTVNTSFVDFFVDKLGAENAANSSAVFDYVKTRVDTNGAEFAVELAKYIKNNSVAAAAEKTVGDGATYIEFTDLPYGYYIVIPTFANTGGINADQPEGIALFMLDTVNNDVEIQNKSKYPTPHKYVSDNDETDSKTNISYINEVLDFKIAGQVPDMSGYKNYVFKINDTAQNMEIKADSVHLQIGSLEMDLNAGVNTAPDGSGMKVTLTLNSSKNQIEVAIDDLLLSAGKMWDHDNDSSTPEVETFSTNRDIFLTYQAKVLPTAVIGGSGNENKVTFTYSNDPTSTGTGTSVPDKTVTFLLGLEIMKVDINNNKLSGAEFQLYVKAGTGASAAYQLIFDTAYPNDPTKNPDGLVYIEDEDTTNGNYNFTIKGINKGEFMLVETEKPEGKVILDSPIYFTINAEGAIVGTDGQITTLEKSITQGAKHVTGTALPDPATGLIPITIRNLTQSELPSTGGAGLYVIAGIAALALAGFGGMAVLKKKVNGIEE